MKRPAGRRGKADPKESGKNVVALHVPIKTSTFYETALRKRHCQVKSYSDLNTSGITESSKNTKKTNSSTESNQRSLRSKNSEPNQRSLRSKNSEPTQRSLRNTSSEPNNKFFDRKEEKKSHVRACLKPVQKKQTFWLTIASPADQCNASSSELNNSRVIKGSTSPKRRRSCPSYLQDYVSSKSNRLSQYDDEEISNRLNLNKSKYSLESSPDSRKQQADTSNVSKRTEKLNKKLELDAKRFFNNSASSNSNKSFKNSVVNTKKIIHQNKKRETRKNPLDVRKEKRHVTSCAKSLEKKGGSWVTIGTTTVKRNFSRSVSSKCSVISTESTSPKRKRFFPSYLQDYDSLKLKRNSPANDGERSTRSLKSNHINTPKLSPGAKKQQSAKLNMDKNTERASNNRAINNRRQSMRRNKSNVLKPLVAKVSLHGADMGTLKRREKYREGNTVSSRRESVKKPLSNNFTELLKENLQLENTKVEKSLLCEKIDTEVPEYKTAYGTKLINNLDELGKVKLQLQFDSPKITTISRGPARTEKMIKRDSVYLKAVKNLSFEGSNSVICPGESLILDNLEHFAEDYEDSSYSVKEEKGDSTVTIERKSRRGRCLPTPIYVEVRKKKTAKDVTKPVPKRRVPKNEVIEYILGGDKAPGRDTMKRKKLLDKKLEDLNKGHEDDLFENNEVCTMKEIFGIDGNLDDFDEADINFSTPKATFHVTPCSPSDERVTPEIDPLDSFCDKNDADAYLYKRKQMLKAKKQGDDSPSKDMKIDDAPVTTIDFAVAERQLDKIISRSASQAAGDDSEDEEDYYFSDSDDSAVAIKIT